MTTPDTSRQARRSDGGRARPRLEALPILPSSTFVAVSAAAWNVISGGRARARRCSASEPPQPNARTGKPPSLRGPPLRGHSPASRTESGRWARGSRRRSCSPRPRPCERRVRGSGFRIRIRDVSPSPLGCIRVHPRASVVSVLESVCAPNTLRPTNDHHREQLAPRMAMCQEPRPGPGGHPLPELRARRPDCLGPVG